MKNLSVKGSNKLILGYLIRVFLSTLISLSILCFAVSQVIYRLDLSMEHKDIISVCIIAISAFIISFVSVSGFKNNGLFAGALSEILLIIISFINLVFNDNSPAVFLIKFFIALLIGAFVGFTRVKKKNTFKV